MILRTNRSVGWEGWAGVAFPLSSARGKGLDYEQLPWGVIIVFLFYPIIKGRKTELRGGRGGNAGEKPTNDER